MAELAARGTAVDGPHDTPTGQFRLAMATDPAGNTIVLAQALTR